MMEEVEKVVRERLSSVDDEIRIVVTVVYFFFFSSSCLFFCTSSFHFFLFLFFLVRSPEQYVVLLEAQAQCNNHSRNRVARFESCRSGLYPNLDFNFNFNVE